MGGYTQALFIKLPIKEIICGDLPALADVENDIYLHGRNTRCHLRARMAVAWPACSAGRSGRVLGCRHLNRVRLRVRCQHNSVRECI